MSCAVPVPANVQQYSLHRPVRAQGALSLTGGDEALVQSVRRQWCAMSVSMWLFSELLRRRVARSQQRSDIQTSEGGFFTATGQAIFNHSACLRASFFCSLGPVAALWVAFSSCKAEYVTKCTCTIESANQGHLKGMAGDLVYDGPLAAC